MREFADLLSIPNLASDNSNIRRNANALVAMLEHRGVAARLLELEGSPPAVLGEIKSPGATRTLVLYAHYDGQPVDPSQWATPPWTPTLRTKPQADGGLVIPFPKDGEHISGESRLYARSSGDDKASIIDIHGEVTAAAENALMDAYTQAGDHNARVIILNFAGMEYMNSSGIGLLVTLLIRINRQKQNFQCSSGNVQRLPQPVGHSDELLRQVMLPHSDAILFPFLVRRFATRLFDTRSFLETDGQGSSAYLGTLVQGHQQGSLQKAQSEHEIHMKRGGQWVALIKGLLYRSPGFMQARINLFVAWFLIPMTLGMEQVGGVGRFANQIQLVMQVFVKLGDHLTRFETFAIGPELLYPRGQCAQQGQVVINDGQHAGAQHLDGDRRRFPIR